MFNEVTFGAFSDELGLIKQAVSSKLIKRVTDKYVRKAEELSPLSSRLARNYQKSLMTRGTLDKGGVRARTDALRLLAGDKAKGSFPGRPKVPKGAQIA